MQKTSPFFKTLLTAITILTLCPAIAQAEMSVQILTAPDQETLPLEVEFEAVVSGGTAPYSYVWGFGDGGTSSLVKDSHYYREAGQYNVYLTVIDSTGKPVVASKTVTVSSSIFNPENAVFTIYSDTAEITSMVRDSRDSSVLWCGTRGGLVRLNTVADEKKFYLNELPNIDVHVVIQATDKAIWVGTGGGLARFDYEKDQWTLFNTENSGLTYNYIVSLSQTLDNAIWVGAYDGTTYDGTLIRFDYEKDQWTLFNTDNSELPGTYIRPLLQTSDGAIWMGTWGETGEGTYSGTLTRFDYEKDQWTLFNTDNSGLPDSFIKSLIQTSDGAVWVGTYNSLARFDYEKDQWTLFNTENTGFPIYGIESLLLTSDGAIWMGAFGGGLVRFDYEKNHWTLFNTDNSGLPENIIWCLQQASDGAIWVGTLESLVRFDYGKNLWTAFNTANSGLPYILIHSNSLLQASDEAIWVGTWHGVTRFDYEQDQWTLFNTDNNGLSFNDIYSLLHTSDDAIWVGLPWELARFDYKKGQWTVFNTANSGLPHGWVTSLLQTTDGAIWVGPTNRNGDGGLARFDYEKDEWTLFNTNNSGLPDNYIRFLIQTSDEAIWIGTDDRDLVRFDYEKNQWTVFNTNNSELPDNDIMTLMQTSDETIWVGTDGSGLARFDYEQEQWTIFNTNNSELPDNQIYSLLQASDGALWGGTKNGLARFDDIARHWTVWNSFNSELSGNAVVSLLQSTDGAIWAGTAESGLNRISFPSTTQSPGHLILLAGGGAAQTNPLWKTTKELATSVYRIFSNRGFKNTDIFFMSPEKWTDFNGDGYDDHIVDRPMPDEDRNLTVADLEYAITERAVNAHTPGTPLFLYIIDHGYADDGIKGPSFMISPGEILYADDLNTMLSTYENATNGQVIVINESCYSGAFMSRLKKPGRIVITSASDHIVNYDNFGSDSFTHHFLRYLFENNTLHQAFSKSVRRLQESNLTFYQTPQLDDNGDGKYDDNDGMLTASLRLGGDFATGAPWPEILSLEKGELTGTSLSFTLSTNARMKRVWATVQPPGYIPDTGGNYQNIELEFFNLSDNDEDLTYTGNYDKFTEKGQYILSFYIKDQFGNVAQSAPVRINTGVSPGDVNGDGDVTLADAVLSLKICAGENMGGQNVSTGADVNQDDKIGTEEAVYILRKVSGL